MHYEITKSLILKLYILFLDLNIFKDEFYYLSHLICICMTQHSHPCSCPQVQCMLFKKTDHKSWICKRWKIQIIYIC